MEELYNFENPLLLPFIILCLLFILFVGGLIKHAISKPEAFEWENNYPTEQEIESTPIAHLLETQGQNLKEVNNHHDSIRRKYQQLKARDLENENSQYWNPEIIQLQHDFEDQLQSLRSTLHILETKTNN